MSAGCHAATRTRSPSLVKAKDRPAVSSENSPAASHSRTHSLWRPAAPLGPDLRRGRETDVCTACDALGGFSGHGVNAPSRRLGAPTRRTKRRKGRQQSTKRSAPREGAGLRGTVWLSRGPSGTATGTENTRWPRGWTRREARGAGADGCCGS